MDAPSPISFDPFIDLNHNFAFFSDIQYENLDDFEDNFIQQLITETDISKSDSTLSNNSIIDFDTLEDQDINLDLLLNQDLDIEHNLSQNFPDINMENDNYIISKPDNGLRINFKKSRKSKGSSILPYSIKDIDEHYRYPNKLTLKNEDLIHGKPGDRIYLSKEETELLLRDGYTIPTHLPLTKAEERALKSIRRKIRNKISAKNSRAKKETYVEGLEQRIILCSKENLMLRQKLAETEKDKKSLFQQVINLQQQLSKFLPKTSTRSTSIMLLLLTFIVVLSPVFDPRRILKSYSIYSEDNKVKQIFPGRTRMLLQESEASTDVGEPYMVTIRSGPPWKIPPTTPAVPLKPIKSIGIDIRSNNISLNLFNETRQMNLVKDL